MNEGLVVHTFSDKLITYLLMPLSSIGGIFLLAIIIGNLVILKKFKRRNRYVNFVLIDTALTSISIVICAISAYIVSKLGPHGGFKADDCDKTYMMLLTFSYGGMVVLSLISIIKTVVQKFIDDKNERKENGGISLNTNNVKGEEKKEKLNITMDALSDKANELKDKVLEIKDKIIKKE